MRLLLSLLPTIALVLAVACSDDTSASATGAGGNGPSSSSGVGGDPPTDAASTGVGGAPDPNVTITSSPCSSATMCMLTFSGSGFDAHDGKTLRWGLLENGSLAFESTAMITDGAFSVSAPLQNGATYYLQYYVDANDNMSCDAPPTDPVWRIDLSTIHQDKSVEVVFSDASFNELGCIGF